MMLGTVKIVVMIVAVLWTICALGVALLIAVFIGDPFFTSPTNWAISLSPAIPLATFYGIDRAER